MFSFLLNVLEVTVVKEIIQVLSIRFKNASSVYCVVCSPPKVRFPSVTQELQARNLHPGHSRKPTREARGMRHAVYCSQGRDASVAAGRSCRKRPRPQTGEVDAHSKTRARFAHWGRSRRLRWVGGSCAAGPGADNHVHGAGAAGALCAAFLGRCPAACALLSTRRG